jgi:hypothetical protein
MYAQLVKKRWQLSGNDRTWGQTPAAGGTNVVFLECSASNVDLLATSLKITTTTTPLFF